MMILRKQMKVLLLKTDDFRTATGSDVDLADVDLADVDLVDPTAYYSYKYSRCPTVALQQALQCAAAVNFLDTL